MDKLHRPEKCCWDVYDGKKITFFLKELHLHFKHMDMEPILFPRSWFIPPKTVPAPEVVLYGCPGTVEVKVLKVADWSNPSCTRIHSQHEQTPVVAIVNISTKGGALFTVNDIKRWAVDDFFLIMEKRAWAVKPPLLCIRWWLQRVMYWWTFIWRWTSWLFNTSACLFPKIHSNNTVTQQYI